MISSNIRGGWLSSSHTRSKHFHGGALQPGSLISDRPSVIRNTIEQMIPQEDQEYYAKFQLPNGGRIRTKFNHLPFKRSKDMVGGQTLPPVWDSVGNRHMINATLQNANPASINVEDDDMTDDADTGVNMIAAQVVSNSAPPPPPAPVNQRVAVRNTTQPSLQSDVLISVFVSVKKQIILADYNIFPPNQNPYNIVSWGKATYVNKPTFNEPDAQLTEMLKIMRDGGVKNYFWFRNENDENALTERFGEEQLHMMDRTYGPEDYYVNFMSELKSPYRNHIAVYVYYLEQYIQKLFPYHYMLYL